MRSIVDYLEHHNDGHVLDAYAKPREADMAFVVFSERTSSGKMMFVTYRSGSYSVTLDGVFVIERISEQGALAYVQSYFKGD